MSTGELNVRGWVLGKERGGGWVVVVGFLVYMLRELELWRVCLVRDWS